MFNRTIYAIVPTLLLVGCSGNVQNPLDRITFRDEPLVRDVENGMSQARVLTIGGEPSRTSARTAMPGLCHDYILNRDGKQQPYYVSFDGTGRVDGQGFLTCKQLEENQVNNRG